jgi:hypothetical protein
MKVEHASTSALARPKRDRQPAFVRPAPVLSGARDSIDKIVHPYEHQFGPPPPGFAWAPCDACGDAIQLKRGRDRRCVLTPGCKGQHRSQLPTSCARMGDHVIGVHELFPQP